MSADVLCRPAKTDGGVGIRTGVVRQAKQNPVADGFVVMSFCWNSSGVYNPAGDTQYNIDVSALQSVYSQSSGVSLTTLYASNSNYNKPTLESIPSYVVDYPFTSAKLPWSLAEYQAVYNLTATGTIKDVYLCVDSNDDYWGFYWFSNPMSFGTGYADFVTWLEDQNITVHDDTSWAIPNFSNEPYSFADKRWVDAITQSINLHTA